MGFATESIQLRMELEKCQSGDKRMTDALHHLERKEERQTQWSLGLRNHLFNC